MLIKKNRRRNKKYFKYFVYKLPGVLKLMSRLHKRRKRVKNIVHYRAGDKSQNNVYYYVNGKYKFNKKYVKQVLKKRKKAKKLRRFKHWIKLGKWNNYGKSKWWKLTKIVPRQVKRMSKLHVVISESLNNMFVTVTKASGDVLYKASIGIICKVMRVERSKTPLVAELLGKYISAKVFSNYCLVLSRFISKSVKSAIKGVAMAKSACVRIKFLHKKAHNGVRKRLPKRK